MDNSELLLTSSKCAQQFSVCLWDYNTKNVLKYYKSGGIATPKGLEIIGQDYILTADYDKPFLHVWPLNSQEVDKNIRLSLPGVATCISVCPKNIYLAVAIETKLYIWHLNSGQLLSVQQTNYQAISCIKFSNNSEYVAVGGQDGLLVVYYLADLISIHQNHLNQSTIGKIDPLYTKNNHHMPITDLHIGIFGRDSRIVTCSLDETLWLYKLATGDCLLNLVFSEPLTSVIFDEPCWKLYVGTNSGIIQQYNLKDPPRTLTHHIGNDDNQQQQERLCPNFIGHKDKIVAIRINSLNTKLATASLDNYVFTWDIINCKILHKFEHKGSITNIMFVTNYSNFYCQTLKPNIVLKSLERSRYDYSQTNNDIDNDNDTDNDNGNNGDGNDRFLVSIIQKEDLELSDDENSIEKEHLRKRIENENRQLRGLNKELFDMLVGKKSV